MAVEVPSVPHSGLHINWNHMLTGLFGMLLIGGILITTAFLTSLLGQLTSLHREVAELRTADELSRKALLADLADLTIKSQKTESGYGGLSSDMSVMQSQQVVFQKGLDALSRVTTDADALRLRVDAVENLQRQRAGVFLDFTRLKESYQADQKLLQDLRQANIQVQSQLQSVLPEIETQFCMEDMIRNANHANDLRTLGSLWEKVFGQLLNTGSAYYPEVCSRAASATAHAASPNIAVSK